ncbi:MAG: DNA-formamidopyrimidine glycosylase [bacterium]|nr:DNA-formamidopyrimidine glycosylase [bacterium]
MPELPEVETIKNDLEAIIIGKKISDAKILWRGALNTPAKKFIALIKNAKILDISRRAKILILTLSNNHSLLIHLKMTGQLIYDLHKKIRDSKYKYARIIFFFKDGSALVFNDLRKFGYVKIVPQNKVKDFINDKKFGPEPLEKDFTLEKFKEILKKYPKRRIKQFLTDPSAIAGIGNIYADEICFYAKVAPTNQVGNLTSKQIKFIFIGIKKILNRAIELRGSSVENYVDASGRKGDYVKELKVYGREGKKCFRCKGIIKRIKLGGRSSHFCPECQK